ncbi:MAG: hypothetical protein AB8H79_02365, partial [Myxococcota bacterium]
MLSLILLALAPTAHAQDCDARALAKEVETASPIAVARTFVKLADCDAVRAKKTVPGAFARILAGGDGNKAALKAIEIGAGADVRAWLGGLEPDQRSRAVAWMGEKCQESEVVQTFFAESKAALGADFWTQRWHRGLVECRVPSIQKVLADAVVDPDLTKDRTRLFNVLEVYARNLRADALPTLSKLANDTSDPEELLYLVNAFADTTGIGSVAGTDKAAANKAVMAIAALGPKLPPRAVDQARITLKTLEAEEESDGFAKYRWPERYTDDTYSYAVAVLETGTCKNGKTLANLHVASFDEGGNQWPDQIQQQLLGKLQFEWELSAAKSCKATVSDFVVEMPKEPFANKEARDLW